ncbi:MAG: MFS transporter [Pedosphaera sp.]|nr:MFS transporter [Pedosphaera sp.]
MPEPGTVQRRQENLWLNLLCNAVLPGFLLSFLSTDQRLGPVWGLIVSLSVPLGYGIWDLWSFRRVNVISIIGISGTLLTGVLGLLKTDGFWIAVKEAALPAILGLAIPLSLRTRQPLVRTLLYNDQVLDTQRIHVALEEKGNLDSFEKLLAWASWVLAASFLLSSVLNFGLARWLITAAPGTPAFNDQLGKMNWLSWPVVMVPSTAIMFYSLIKLLKGVEALTGLKGDELFHHRNGRRRSASVDSDTKPRE